MNLTLIYTTLGANEDLYMRRETMKIVVIFGICTFLITLQEAYGKHIKFFFVAPSRVWYPESNYSFPIDSLGTLFIRYWSSWYAFHPLLILLVCVSFSFASLDTRFILYWFSWYAFYSLLLLLIHSWFSFYCRKYFYKFDFSFFIWSHFFI